MPNIKSDTLRDRIYEELVQMITSGALPPGAPIDEKALTESLGVSRTPFREAIAILASDGLVDVRPYRGFSVRRFTRKEINDLYLLRRTLECFAIRLAVENISNLDIARLEQVLDRGVAALVSGRQVAVFLLATGDLYALDNHDPCSGANVLSRGLVGDVDGTPTVASPVFKQRFDLRTGRCIDDESVRVATWKVRKGGGVVEVGVPR